MQLLSCPAGSIHQSPANDCKAEDLIAGQPINDTATLGCRTSGDPIKPNVPNSSFRASMQESLQRMDSAPAVAAASTANQSAGLSARISPTASKPSDSRINCWSVSKPRWRWRKNATPASNRTPSPAGTPRAGARHHKPQDRAGGSCKSNWTVNAFA